MLDSENSDTVISGYLTRTLRHPITRPVGSPSAVRIVPQVASFNQVAKCQGRHRRVLPGHRQRQVYRDVIYSYTTINYFTFQYFTFQPRHRTPDFFQKIVITANPAVARGPSAG